MAAATSRPRPKVMTLTDAAAERVRQIMAKAETPVRRPARRRQERRLCRHGIHHGMGRPEQKPFDEVIEDKGVKVLIDAKAIMFLLGTEMDFQTSALKSGFVFNNPNQTSACGCGESVQMKPASPRRPAGA